MNPAIRNPQSAMPRGRPPVPANMRADSQIQLRVTRRRKTAYVRHANQGQETLAGMIFRVVDKASGYRED